MDKVVIGDNYHVTIMDENMNWTKLTHLFLGLQFVNLPLLKISLYPFLHVCIREKQHLSLMYIMYTNASNNTPSNTHVCSYVVWTVHPQVLTSWKVWPMGILCAYGGGLLSHFYFMLPMLFSIYMCCISFLLWHRACDFLMVVNSSSFLHLQFQHTSIMSMFIITL